MNTYTKKSGRETEQNQEIRLVQVVIFFFFINSYCNRDSIFFFFAHNLKSGGWEGPKGGVERSSRFLGRTRQQLLKKKKKVENVH